MLPWAAIDLRAGVIHVVPTKVSGKKPAAIHIPIMPELATALKTARKSNKSKDVLPSLQAQYDKDSSSLSKAFGAVVDSAKIKKTTAEGIAVYRSLRKTFVTMMDEAGTPTKITDAITGHAPQSMHDRYSQPDAAVAQTYMEKALTRLVPLKKSK